MEKSVRRFAVDRLEGGFAVLLPDDGGDEMLLSLKDYPTLSENDVVDVTFTDGEIATVVSLPDEKMRRLDDCGARLSALFSRSKNRPPKA